MGSTVVDPLSTRFPAHTDGAPNINPATAPITNIPFSFIVFSFFGFDFSIPLLRFC
jgi:hypothetical protein